MNLPSGDHVGSHPSFDSPMEMFNLMFSPNCVAELNRITDTTDAQIVVSSDWKLHFDFKGLVEELTLKGISGEILGTTEDLAPM